MGFIEEDISEEKSTNRTSPIQFSGNRANDLHKLEITARDQIRQFFLGKKYHCGGSIPLSLLYSRQSVNIVLGTSFGDGIDLCHEIIGPGPMIDGQVSWSTSRLLPILHETHQRRIHGDFRAGMILLYLKFCMGKKLPEIPCDVTRLLA